MKTIFKKIGRIVIPTTVALSTFVAILTVEKHKALASTCTDKALSYSTSSVSSRSPHADDPLKNFLEIMQKKRPLIQEEEQIWRSSYLKTEIQNHIAGKGTITHVFSHFYFYSYQFSPYQPPLPQTKLYFVQVLFSSPATFMTFAIDISLYEPILLHAAEYLL